MIGGIEIGTGYSELTDPVEQRKKFEAWAGPIEARGRLQHVRILAELEAERAERALTEPELWGPV